MLTLDSSLFQPVVMALRGKAYYEELSASNDESRFLRLSQGNTASSIKDETQFTLWTVNEVHNKHAHIHVRHHHLTLLGMIGTLHG